MYTCISYYMYYFRSWQKRSVIILATFVALCLVVSYKGLGIHVDINNSHVYMGMNNLVSGIICIHEHVCMCMYNFDCGVKAHLNLLVYNVAAAFN